MTSKGKPIIIVVIVDPFASFTFSLLFDFRRLSA